MGIIKKIIDGSNGHKLKRTVLVIEEQVQNQNFIRRALRKKYQISMTANREVAYAFPQQFQLVYIRRLAGPFAGNNNSIGPIFYRELCGLNQAVFRKQF